MGVQKVRKYHGAEHALVAADTNGSATISFNNNLSALQIAVDDSNAVGSPVHVRLDGVDDVIGSAYPVFDGTSDLFEVRLSKGETIRLTYAGSPTTTANVHVIGYYHIDDQNLN